MCLCVKHISCRVCECLLNKMVYGQNGIRAKWYTGKMIFCKVVRTKWCQSVFIKHFFLYIHVIHTYCTFIYLSIYEIYIAPLQGNYSEALPSQARAKIKVLRSASS